MNAEYFFKHHITDNSYQGFSISDIEINQDFNCNTYRKKRDSLWWHRSEGIKSFIEEIKNGLFSENINDLRVDKYVFDEEFDANTDQSFFTVSGSEFEDIRIHTGNIVGSVIHNSHSFSINCRFGNQFLQYMIASTSGFLEIENLGAIDSSVGLGEWIMIYYWKLQLKKAFSSGLYKTYEKKSASLSKIRGSININAYIKKSYFDGKTRCDYREHSYNNDINAVINMALNQVFESKYLPIVSDIFDVKNAFNSINTDIVQFRDLSNATIRNPFYKQYGVVYDLSVKLLKGEFANIGTNQNNFSAFLFDISLLFEHHIRQILKQRFQLFRKNRKEFRVPNGVYTSHLFPDVIIDFGEGKIGIYDVKYKHFDRVHGVSREDRFQLISYVATHMSRYKVVECGIIYPLKAKDVVTIEKNQFIDLAGSKIPFQVKFYKVADQIKDQLDLDKTFRNQFYPM